MASNLVNIGEDLTDTGFERLKVGQILRFQSDEGETEFKIITMNKKKRVCMVRPVKTFLPEDLDGTVRVVDK